MCCDVGLVSEFRLTAGCVLMDLASPAVSGTSVYANGLRASVTTVSIYVRIYYCGGGSVTFARMDRRNRKTFLNSQPKLKPTSLKKHVTCINLLKPTGYVMHQQFNIQQLYALPIHYLRVLYLSQNKQRLVPLTA